MRHKNIFLPIFFLLFFFQCIAQTPHNGKPSDPSLIKGKGQLSFKLDGQVWSSDPLQTKCWTTASVPVAMLWAKGDRMDISWQIQNMRGKGTYKISRDSAGTVNFSIAGKTYWVRRTDGSNYLSITITDSIDKYKLKLLSGSFEGILEDKHGIKVRITDGRFTTLDI